MSITLKNVLNRPTGVSPRKRTRFTGGHAAPRAGTGTRALQRRGSVLALVPQGVTAAFQFRAVRLYVQKSCVFEKLK